MFKETCLGVSVWSAEKQTARWNQIYKRFPGNACASRNSFQTVMLIRYLGKERGMEGLDRKSLRLHCSSGKFWSCKYVGIIQFKYLYHAQLLAGSSAGKVCSGLNKTVYLKVCQLEAVNHLGSLHLLKADLSGSIPSCGKKKI